MSKKYKRNLSKNGMIDFFSFLYLLAYDESILKFDILVE
jgi:hypothetical protein